MADSIHTPTFFSDADRSIRSGYEAHLLKPDVSKAKAVTTHDNVLCHASITLQLPGASLYC